MPSASVGPLLASRFWSHVRFSDGCWEWTGKRVNGYGRVIVQRKERLAHRVSWEITRGELPEGSHVLHHCDNPPCVRPDHLFLGTQADNLADMRTKGRGRPVGFSSDRQPKSERRSRGEQHWTHLHPERVPRGERHWRERRP